MAPVYSWDQFLYLQKLLDAAKSHCAAGWDVTVALQCANGLSSSHPRYLELTQRSFCYRREALSSHMKRTDEPTRHVWGRHDVPIVVETYDKIG